MKLCSRFDGTHTLFIMVHESFCIWFMCFFFFVQYGWMEIFHVVFFISRLFGVFVHSYWLHSYWVYIPPNKKVHPEHLHFFVTDRNWSSQYGRYHNRNIPYDQNEAEKKLNKTWILSKNTLHYSRKKTEHKIETATQVAMEIWTRIEIKTSNKNRKLI